MQDESEGPNPLLGEMNILRLSDEVLVNICSYLTSEDTVSLSCTCKRFNDILCERKLVRCVNLKAAYSVPPDLMKSFFRPLFRCERVETMNLSSCYWLTSSEILWILQRLTNLKSLHVHDTNLSIEHLTLVMKNIKSIECLSWTYQTEKINCSNIQELSNQLHSLKSFNLWTSGFGLFFIPMLLEKCSSLERLEVSTLRNKDLPTSTPGVSFYKKLNFPKIKSLVLCFPLYIPHYFQELIHACDHNVEWETLWIHPDRIILDFRRFSVLSAKEIDAVSFNLKQEEMVHVLKLKSLKYFCCFSEDIYNDECETLFKKSSITHLYWGNEDLPESLPENLQHLNVYTSCLHLNKCPSRTLYEFAPNLTFVSVPACILLSPTKGCKTTLISFGGETSQKNSARQSHLGNTTNTECFLKVLIEVAPNLRRLEMKCHRDCSRLTPNQCVSISLINWPQLESLFLANIPLIDFSTLCKVCVNCPKLRRLGMRQIGLSATFSQTLKLVQAINTLQNLEDFQFQHTYVNQLDPIIKALSDRPKLRRVLIICNTTPTPLNVSSYLKLIEKCSHLVFLLACVTTVTKKAEKYFQKEVKARFLKERRCLWASLRGFLHNNFKESIPLIHYLEMFNNETLVPFVKD